MPSGVSVIICTYNGKNRLASTLEHLTRQVVSQTLNVELIVVDNNSNDNTANWSREWLSSHDSPFSWKVISEPKAGLSYARRTGLLHASNELILFCDDDNCLAPDYIAIGHKLLLENQNWAALGGCGKAVFDDTPPSWFDRFYYSYATGPQAENSGELPIGTELYGAGCFFRKAPLLKLYEQGFTSALKDREGNLLSSGGDVELCYAVQLMGYKIAYESSLHFDHYIPGSRLTEAYYLKLKKAIASQAGVLFAYQYILTVKDSKFWMFYVAYVKKNLVCLLQFLGSSVKEFLGLTRGTALEKKIAKTVLKTQFLAFARQWYQSGRHFQNLLHFTSLDKVSNG